MMQDGFGGFHKSSDFHLKKTFYSAPCGCVPWLQVLCTTGSLPAAGRRRGRCWGAPAAQQNTALQRRISGNSRWAFLGPLAAFSWARNSIFYLSFLFLFSYLAIAQNLQKRIDSRFVRPWSAFVMSTEKTAPNEIVAGQGLTSRPLNGPASWSVGGPNSWTGSRWSHPALGNEKHLEFTVDELFESVWWIFVFFPHFFFVFCQMSKKYGQSCETKVWKRNVKMMLEIILNYSKCSRLEVSALNSLTLWISYRKHNHGFLRPLAKDTKPALFAIIHYHSLSIFIHLHPLCLLHRRQCFFLTQITSLRVP